MLNSEQSTPRRGSSSTAIAHARAHNTSTGAHGSTSVRGADGGASPAASARGAHAGVAFTPRTGRAAALRGLSPFAEHSPTRLRYNSVQTSRNVIADNEAMLQTEAEAAAAGGAGPGVLTETEVHEPGAHDATASAIETGTGSGSTCTSESATASDSGSGSGRAADHTVSMTDAEAAPVPTASASLTVNTRTENIVDDASDDASDAEAVTDRGHLDASASTYTSAPPVTLVGNPCFLCPYSAAAHALTAPLAPAFS